MTKSVRKRVEMRKGTAKKVVKASDLASGVNPDPDAVIPVSLRLPTSLHERLRKLSFDTRRPMTEFLIRGAEMVLKAEKY